MMGALTQQLYGNYRNKKFTDIWPDVSSFLNDYWNAGLVPNLAETYMTTLYYLLYARYGNSTIASFDETQFKYKVFSTIFMYGPTWAKRLDIQTEVRQLTIQEVQKGGKAIYNSALNPNQAPTTSSLEELKYINQQNTSNYLKSKPEAYAIIIDLLETDVTEEFIERFKKLFLTIVSPERPLWYITSEETGDDQDDN